MAQHASLAPERWSRFSLDQQVLMIGNEMNRASKLMGAGDRERRERCYERVLALTDLTIEVNPGRSLRREMLRWRDLVAELYISGVGDPERHRAAFRALLFFTPEAARQVPLLPATRSR